MNTELEAGADVDVQKDNVLGAPDGSIPSLSTGGGLDSSASSVVVPGHPSARLVLKWKLQDGKNYLSTPKESSKSQTEIFEEIDQMSRAFNETGRKRKLLQDLDQMMGEVNDGVESAIHMAKITGLEPWNDKQEDAVSLASDDTTPMDGISEGALGANKIPPLKILPYLPRNLLERTSVDQLLKFGQKWNSLPEFDVTTVNKGSGPVAYSAQVSAGCRKGVGEGATVSEAKALAAAACLDEMTPFMPRSQLPSYNEVVKTAPDKDILYVLYKLCEDYGLKKPEYMFKVTANGEGQKYECVANIGDLETTAEADMKRVGIRFAAIEMYKKVRNLHNKGELPSSSKLNQ